MSDKINYTRKGDIAVLRIQNPPVNALSHAVREGLVAGIAQAEADAGVKAVVIVGEGRDSLGGLLVPFRPAIERIVPGGAGLDDAALLAHPALRDKVAALLADYNAGAGGSSGAAAPAGIPLSAT